MENQVGKASSYGGNVENQDGNTKNQDGNAGNQGGNAGNQGGKAENQGVNAGNQGGNAENQAENAGKQGGNAGNQDGNALNQGGNAGHQGDFYENFCVYCFSGSHHSAFMGNCRTISHTFHSVWVLPTPWMKKMKTWGRSVYCFFVWCESNWCGALA